MSHWVGHYGRPTTIVMDQGGEFDKEWILMLESLGIFSETTGAHAGWQHAFAERQGGILGMLALFDHGVPGSDTGNVIYLE